MKHISIHEAQTYTSPNPVAIICVKTPLNTTNLATVSWWTYLSNNPPMLSFSISKKSYTSEIISKDKQVVLSIPGKNIVQETFQCGCCSGRSINKSDKFNIELTGSILQYPIHSKLAFLCILSNIIDVGDHKLCICNVNDIIYNESEIQIYSWDGYKHLDTL